MTGRGKGKWLYRGLAIACSSAAIWLSGSARAGEALAKESLSPSEKLLTQTLRPSKSAIAVRAKLSPLYQMPNPELPPLGETAKYIPLEELYPLETTPRGTHLVLSLSERRVYLYRDDREIASYPVAIGKEGWETPTGTFKVIDKVRDPAWEHPWTGEIVPPGPENPLGTRWIGFWTDGTNYIGFHGTPNEELVGQAVSHGCVRMKNQDILSLFEQVHLGVTVTVKP